MIKFLEISVGLIFQTKFKGLTAYIGRQLGTAGMAQRPHPWGQNPGSCPCVHTWNHRSVETALQAVA